MARDKEIKVEGLRDLEKALVRLQKEYGGNTAVQALRPAVKAAMGPLVATVKMATPVDTGDLSNSVKLKTGKPTKKMLRSSHYYNSAYKSNVVIYGQVGWFFPKGRENHLKAVAVEYGTRNVPASFALRGALEGNETAIINRFKNTLGPAIEKKAAAAARKRNR
tara:strand:- start:443 stop:934 length:492 start_codon:yes stop_codon:yes gene_type:complete